MPTVPCLTKCRGLNIKVDPVRLPSDPENGTWLVSTKNVEVDDTGRVSRRKGYTRVLTGAWHSLFSCSKYMIGVKGDALSVITPSGYTPIRNVTPGLKTSYAIGWDGRNEIIYHANSVEYGKIVDGVAYALSILDRVGPTTSRDITVMNGRLKHLAIGFGRLFASEGSTVWYSEPFFYEAVDKARNYWMFEDEVIGIMPIRAGVVVGTTRALYLIRGELPDKIERVPLSSSGMVEWTQTRLTGSSLAFGGAVVSEGWVLCTTDGISLISENGEIVNVSGAALSLPSGLAWGAGIVFRDKILMTLEG